MSKPSGPDINEYGPELIARYLNDNLTDEEKKKWNIEISDQKVRGNYPQVIFNEDPENFVHINDIKEFEVELEEDIITTYKVTRKQ